MWSDPIIDTIHKIREEHAAQFKYNLKSIYEDLKKIEKNNGLHYIEAPIIQNKSQK